MHGRRVSEERSRIRDNEWGDCLAACGALRLVGCRGFMFGLADGVVGLTRTMQKGAASLAPAVQKNRSHAASQARSVHVSVWGRRLMGNASNQSHSTPSLTVYARVAKQKALASSKPGSAGLDAARLRRYGNQSGPYVLRYCG
jgi:hypothetical protein